MMLVSMMSSLEAGEGSQWLGPQEARHFWQTLRRNLPKFRNRRLLYDPVRIEALDEQWMPHFCQLEVGSSIPPQTLLRTRQTQ